MSSVLSENVLQDSLAVSVARILAAANQRAGELGVNASQSLISISQHPENGGLLWRVNYGPKDYVGRRGGDLIIEVDPSDAGIKQVLWGQ